VPEEGLTDGDGTAAAAAVLSAAAVDAAEDAAAAAAAGDVAVVAAAFVAATTVVVVLWPGEAVSISVIVSEAVVTIVDPLVVAVVVAAAAAGATAGAGAGAAGVRCEFNCTQVSKRNGWPDTQALHEPHVPALLTGAQHEHVAPEDEEDELSCLPFLPASAKRDLLLLL
jgi:hypothetical protein